MGHTKAVLKRKALNKTSNTMRGSSMNWLMLLLLLQRQQQQLLLGALQQERTC